MYDPDGKDLQNIGEVSVYTKEQLGMDLVVETHFNLQVEQIYEYINLEFLKGRPA